LGTPRGKVETVRKPDFLALGMIILAALLYPGQVSRGCGAGQVFAPVLRHLAVGDGTKSSDCAHRWTGQIRNGGGCRFIPLVPLPGGGSTWGSRPHELRHTSVSPLSESVAGGKHPPTGSGNPPRHNGGQRVVLRCGDSVYTGVPRRRPLKSRMQRNAAKRRLRAREAGCWYAVCNRVLQRSPNDREPH
jgi:hypothetical protein